VHARTAYEREISEANENKNPAIVPEGLYRTISAGDAAAQLNWHGI
jgi:hypothetical protein